MSDNRVNTAKSELEKLNVIGYESYGSLSSPEALKTTISYLKSYDKEHKPEDDVLRIREIELARRKG
jgi:hypothetical protein